MTKRGLKKRSVFVFRHSFVIRHGVNLAFSYKPAQYPASVFVLAFACVNLRNLHALGCKKIRSTKIAESANPSAAGPLWQTSPRARDIHSGIDPLTVPDALVKIPLVRFSCCRSAQFAGDIFLPLSRARP